MNTRDIAEEFRLRHWAGIMREREESGLSIKAFCEKAGFHENKYFYWQKRLRELACDELAILQDSIAAPVPAGFAEVKLAGLSEFAPPASALQGQICIDAAGVRIAAGSEYPAEKLAVLLREVARL
jgi:hypothetical protein